MQNVLLNKTIYQTQFVINISVAISANLKYQIQLPPTKVGGLRLRPPPTKSERTVADYAKTIFTEHVMKLIAFKTLNAPAKAGGFYQLMEN
ncbi:hypothetical protein [Candidatus Nitrotoga arctica]|uniref:Uncharacterized protein n=1 Tax=Candidatus Nitrotoga arctica TaxID=453162 RepID=A0ABM8YYN1_9PROT|nr:hypothetical protein [Candidatus Nitrotoga arctica]CAG9932648.1 protein of unknown function [Candidatus Nitrotoga arctica]